MNIKIESINKDVEVKKQPVGKFIQALKVLKNIPKHLGGIDKLGETEVIAALPDMIASSYDEIAEVITITTALTKDDVDAIYPEELVNLAAEIIKINEFTKLGDVVKKKFGNLNLTAKKI